MHTHTHCHTAMPTGVTSSSCHLSLIGPLPPQNVTVGPITVSQVSVRWLPTGAQIKAGWMFVVRYTDLRSRQERIVGMTNISRVSQAGGLQSYTAVIGGLESYRKYKFEVYSVTLYGIESCGQEPVTMQTGEHLTGLVNHRQFESTLAQWPSVQVRSNSISGWNGVSQVVFSHKFQIGLQYFSAVISCVECQWKEMFCYASGAGVLSSSLNSCV